MSSQHDISVNVLDNTKDTKVYEDFNCATFKDILKAPHNLLKIFLLYEHVHHLFLLNTNKARKKFENLFLIHIAKHILIDVRTNKVYI